MAAFTFHVFLVVILTGFHVRIAQDLYLNTVYEYCPTTYYFKCDDGQCIPGDLRCNGQHDCQDASDENGCAYQSEQEAADVRINEEDNFSVDSSAKRNLVNWFLGHRKQGATTNKWGRELPRTAVALFLADKGFFTSGNMTMEEMSYELSNQLLSFLAEDGGVKRKDLATYIQAMMVTCIDPRNFHGRDLVSELRTTVEGSGDTTINPFEILVLCNAGDKMSEKDVERVLTAYNARSRPFWTDNQAMSTIALACMLLRSDVPIDDRTFIDMEQELKERQFKNGTVENIKTTALVVQALMATQSYKTDFDFESAIKGILQSQKSDGSIGSFLDSYYILPALSKSSLVDITSEHCKRPATSEEDVLNLFQKTRGEVLSTQYSVWIGTEVDLKSTWTLNVPLNSSLYDIMEIVNRLDTRQQIAYNLVDEKPYVSSLTGLQDDLEMGFYWFTYLRTQNSEEDPTIVEESPVDVKILPNQELILWYRSG